MRVTLVHDKINVKNEKKTRVMSVLFGMNKAILRYRHSFIEFFALNILTSWTKVTRMKSYPK